MVEKEPRLFLRQKPYPFAWIGYAYATAVGFIWGSLLSRGKIERHGKLFIFRGMPSWSFGRGGACVGACYLTSNNVSPAILQHEEIHRRQWRRFGMMMPLLYLLAGRDPLRNVFEIEAGLVDGGYLRANSKA